MIIKHAKDVPCEEMKDYAGVKKQVFIGPKDGSNEIVLRYFSVAPGGNTPYHQHGFPHLVKIEKGTGVAIDAKGIEHPLMVNDLIFITDNEIHGFKNNGTENFDFICIVPRRGEK